jgi:MFS family permease
MLPATVTVVLVTPALSLGALAALMREDFSLSASEIGTIFALFFLCSALSASAGDRVGQRFSATSVVRAAVLCGALVCVVIATVQTKAVLVLGCLVAGAANGLAAPALSMLILWLVPAQRHGLAFGLRVAAAPGTTTLAALGAYGLVAAGWAWSAFYWFTAALGCGVAAALSAASARDPGVTVPGPKVAARSPLPGSLKLLALGGLLGAMASTVIAPFLLVGLIDMGHDAGGAAGLLAIGGWLVIGGRIVAGLASDRIPRPLAHIRTVAWMLLTCGAGMTVLAWEGSYASIVAATLVAMGLGWSWPGLLHHAVITTYPVGRARAASMMQTGTYLVSVIGPLGFGLTADLASFPAAWASSSALAMVSALFLLGGVRLVERRRPVVPPVPEGPVAPPVP